MACVFYKIILIPTSNKHIRKYFTAKTNAYWKGKMDFLDEYKV